MLRCDTKKLNKKKLKKRLVKKRERKVLANLLCQIKVELSMRKVHYYDQVHIFLIGLTISLSKVKA